MAPVAHESRIVIAVAAPGEGEALALAEEVRVLGAGRDLGVARLGAVLLITAVLGGR